MATTKTRPPRLPNGTHVHVRSDHFVEECDAVIRKAQPLGEPWLAQPRVDAARETGRLRLHFEHVHDGLDLPTRQAEGLGRRPRRQTPLQGRPNRLVPYHLCHGGRRLPIAHSVPPMPECTESLSSSGVT